jgi:quinoprotein glucose dehydrogenase
MLLDQRPHQSLRQERKLNMRWFLCLLLATAVVAQQPSTKNGDWPSYTADLKGTKYSPLDQINASNFNKLEIGWRFKTDNLGPRPEYKLEGTPLVIKGVLYTTGGTRRAVKK